MPLCDVDYSKNTDNHAKQKSCLNEHLNTYHQNHALFCNKHIYTPSRLSPQNMLVPFLDKINNNEDTIPLQTITSMEKRTNPSKGGKLVILNKYTTKLNKKKIKTNMQPSPR